MTTCWPDVREESLKSILENVVIKQPVTSIDSMTLSRIVFGPIVVVKVEGLEGWLHRKIVVGVVIIGAAVVALEVE